MPEFRDAKAEDYEFRSDGKLVRKDRWEQGIQSIRFLVGLDGREFEIDEVIDRVRKMAAGEERWYQVSRSDDSEIESDNGHIDMRLSDGSVLQGGTYDRKAKVFAWRGLQLERAEVREWRAHESEPEEGMDP